MHKIFELKAMELEQLQSLAGELSIKGFKKMEKDDLVYAIIDAEAIKSAQAPVERPAKKRGRPKKEEPQQDVTPVATEQNNQTEVKQDKPKHEKRDRKAKSENRPAPAETPAPQTEETKASLLTPHSL